METKLKYPVGEQSFPALVRGGYIYVDKTRYIEKILNGGKYYFLGRPRRFGKSLFLSTLRSFFEGRHELFKGLYADSMAWDWEPYPVLYLDLNIGTYREETIELQQILENYLSDWEEKYDISKRTDNIALRFRDIIKAAYLRIGKPVVILVDEYDKPLVNTLNDDESFHVYRDALSGLYSNFKSSADYIQLVFITGVSRFGKLNVFSGLNNIQDISFDSRFSSICGITENELADYFSTGIQALANKRGISMTECMGMIKEWYDGYHFTEDCEDIYNPFSVLNCLDSQRFSAYWMTSGGRPSILLESIRNYNIDLLKFFNSRCTQNSLLGIDHNSQWPVSLFYQTGYLTIKGYDEGSDLYTLGLPNMEVRKGLFDFLLPYYTNLHNEESAFVVSEFVRDFKEGNAECVMRRLQSLFSSVSYQLHIETENNFHNALYILCMLLGLNIRAEYATSDGRIDLFIATDHYCYIIELKKDSTPEAAMRQILDKNYTMPFLLGNRELILIGANFSTKTRTISGWVTDTISQA